MENENNRSPDIGTPPAPPPEAKSPPPGKNRFFDKRGVFTLVFLLVLITFFAYRHLGPSSKEQSAEQKTESRAEKRQREIAARIDRFKAELEEVRANKREDGKFGILTPLDAKRAEVVLPAALALVGDDFKEYGVEREALAREIKAHPKDFVQPVPELARKRFLILTPELEARVGRKMQEDVLAKSELYHDEKAQQRVDAIAERLSAQLPEKTPVKVILIKDESVNASSFPDGTIVVHSALLEKVKSDDELAFVMGCEYAHLAARHVNEKITKQILARAGEVLAEDQGNQLEKRKKFYSAIFLQVSRDVGSVVAFQLPNIRKMELEADVLGLRYMIRAGYDPQGAADFFQRIRDPEESLWKEYLSVRPNVETRMARLQAEWAALNGKDKPNPFKEKLAEWKKTSGADASTSLPEEQEDPE